jgi:hypothetical protein
VIAVPPTGAMTFQAEKVFQQQTDETRRRDAA